MINPSKRRKRRKTTAPGSDADRITNLAPELIEQILLHLPVMDAIRMGTLSRSWCGRWCFAVRHLDFSEVEISRNRTHFQEFVDGVFKAVTGPIDSFTLSAHNPDSNILRWMEQALSRGATAFDVCIGPPFNALLLPEAFLSCQRLTSLRLAGFGVGFPPGLKGFERLTKLHLFHCVLLSESVLSRLIANSPYLTELDIIGVEMGCLDLEIESPSLCSLSIWSDGGIQRFSMKNCPNLKDAYISIQIFDPDIRCSLTNILPGSYCKLEELELDSHFRNYSHTSKLPHELAQLCKLRLHINLRLKEELDIAFCILRSSPSIQDLIVYPLDSEPVGGWEEEEVEEQGLVENSAGEVWEEGERLGLTLNQLTSVTLDFSTSWAATRRIHLNFCKFLLANSPILHDFTVRVLYCGLSKEEQGKMLQDLSVLPKASRSLKIRVKV